MKYYLDRYGLFSKQINKASAISGRSRLKLIFEVFLLKAINKIEWKDYFFGKLYSHDISLSEKLNYFGCWQKDRLLKKMNPYHLRVLTENKYIQKLIFAALKVPMPRLYGFLHAENGISYSGNRLQNIRDVDTLLNELGVESCVLKPISSNYGEGIKFYSSSPVGDKKKSDYFITRDSIDSLKYIGSSGYVCEEQVVQHAFMNEINPCSLNTLRLWTYKKGAEVDVLGVFLRTSRGVKPVDNTSTGGIVARVDVETGEIVSDLFAVDDSFLVFEVSPMGTLHVKGSLIPYWPEVIELSKSAARCFSDLRLLALDIGISEAGPVCIEVNSSGAFQGQFLMGYGFGKLKKTKA